MDHDNPQDQAPAPDNVITFPAPAPSQTDTTTPQDVCASTHTRKARGKGQNTSKGTGARKTKGRRKGKKKTYPRKSQAQKVDIEAPDLNAVRPSIGTRGKDGKLYKLTDRQDRFCSAYVNSNSASEAYRQVYDCSRSKPAAIRVNASRLLLNPNVQHRLAQLKAARDAQTSLSRQWVLDRLMEHAEVCLGKKKIKLTKANRDGQTIEIEATMHDQSAANRALELLGKEAGMFIDRRETGGPGDFARMGDDELREYVAREMAQAEEMRKRTGTDG